MGIEIRGSYEEIAEWYDTLPTGASTRCYQCGHEGGPLSTAPEVFQGWCVDRNGCYGRQAEKRREIWERQGEQFGICHCCGRYGDVIDSAVGQFYVEGEARVPSVARRYGCVDARDCNVFCCEQHGHHESFEQRICITPGGFGAGMRNIGRNRWKLCRYCFRCAEITFEFVYQEGEGDAVS